jgi:hypothetical protein
MATIPFTNPLNNPFSGCSVVCFVSILMNFFLPISCSGLIHENVFGDFFIDFNVVIYFAHFSLVVYFHQLVFGDFSIPPIPKRPR